MGVILHAHTDRGELHIQRNAKREVATISTIDHRHPKDKTHNVKRRKKGHEGKVNEKIPAMIQR